jgi:hypothetical protein
VHRCHRNRGHRALAEHLFGRLDVGRRTGQGGLEEAADEVCLAVGSCFVEDVLGVSARGGLGDLELFRGSEEPVAANDFRKHPYFGSGQFKTCGKALDLSPKISRAIDNQDGSGRPGNVKNGRREVGGERDDMGKEKSVIFAARQL